MRPVKFPRAFSLIELSIVVLIIGLIVIGVIAGKKLVSRSNIAKARALTNSAPVNTTEDLVFWVETTSKNSFNTVPTNGTAISSWNDSNTQLTSKKNLTNVTGQPIYNESVINGLPAIVYDGASCLYTAANFGSSDVSTKSQATVFVVGRHSTTNTALLVSIRGDDGNRGPEVEFHTSNPRFNMVNTLLTSSNVFTKDVIISGVKDSANMYLYVNGALDTSQADSTTVVPFTSKSIYVGCWDTTNGFYVAGEIGEVIIFARALSDFERKEIEKYLSKKWGIALS